MVVTPASSSSSSSSSSSNRLAANGASSTLVIGNGGNASLDGIWPDLMGGIESVYSQEPMSKARFMLLYS